MNEDEVQRAYDVGDRVVSLHALVAPPPNAWEVGVEIPGGSVGEVVDVREYRYQYPYIVKFDIGIEISVTEEDIIHAVNSVDQVVPPLPLVDVTPSGPAVGFRPTVRHPHRWCAVLHHVQAAQFAVVFGVLVAWRPLPVLGATAAVITVAVIMHLLLNGREWPSLYDKEPTLLRGERLIQTPNALIAVLLDGAFCLGVVASLVLYYDRGVFSLPIMLGLTVLGWIVNEFAHDRGTTIVGN